MNGVKILRKNPGALDNLAKQLKALSKKKEIAIGYPAGKAQAYTDGTPVVEVAAAHVFGVGVPERDFMALAKKMMMPKIKPLLRKWAKLAAKPNPTPSDLQALTNVMEALGQIGQAEVQQAIVDGSWEPNSSKPMSPGLRAAVSESWGIDIPDGISYRDAKLKFRGSDKPLVDTGHLVQAATYVVRDKKEYD